jgi:hypothetical protein
MRGIQYAAASRFHRYRLGVLDHPLSRMMTTEGVARSINVIASEAKQSIPSLRGEMDCFAEPVIGRAFALPVGSQ